MEDNKPIAKESAAAYAAGFTTHTSGAAALYSTHNVEAKPSAPKPVHEEVINPVLNRKISPQKSKGLTRDQSNTGTMHSNVTVLPKGWERKLTTTGRVYYVDHNTHTTSWILPSISGGTMKRTPSSKVHIGASSNV